MYGLKDRVSAALRGAGAPVGPRQHVFPNHTVVEERQISEGGFAFIWASRDVRTGEKLALKNILCQNALQYAKAMREVELLDRLPNHPNLVKYYGHTVVELGHQVKEVILLFEMCSGGHLLDLLDRYSGQLGEKRILAIFTDICKAVDVLHAQSPPIQHRDLKVENILFASDGTLRLCDFGSWSDARVDIGSLDKHGLAEIGEEIDRHTTMMYRPPEMVDFFRGAAISEKVDVWMLGCLLYTLMYYRHPFQDESSLAIANVRYDFPPSPQYSRQLQEMVRWLLTRDPNDRPSTKELLRELTGSPVKPGGEWSSASAADNGWPGASVPEPRDGWANFPHGQQAPALLPQVASQAAPQGAAGHEYEWPVMANPWPTEPWSSTAATTPVDARAHPRDKSKRRPVVANPWPTEPWGSTAPVDARAHPRERRSRSAPKDVTAWPNFEAPAGKHHPASAERPVSAAAFMTKLAKTRRAQTTGS
eukprot:NODE_4063_length_1941_cov_15.514884.p1 GENE.NODE_4063_length_1941_cov_15.514884~~NODE_4063_length_1941_cov_15.514884.p1  ORF type:complete len:477 (-),score=64.12 NODE_4063_length_1941_cov_15.514884:353-1783(-)